MAKRGPKQLEKTEAALRMHLVGGKPVVKAAYLAGINPSTLYRALQRYKGKR